VRSSRRSAFLSSRVTAKPVQRTPTLRPRSGERAATFEKRVALVIGNSNYQNGPALQNPQRDAATVAKALEAVGFQNVTLQINLGREQLVDRLRAFAKEAENADWAVVYYAAMASKSRGLIISSQSMLKSPPISTSVWKQFRLIKARW
jgi:Caspase domain